MRQGTLTEGPDPATERLGLGSVVALIFVCSWPSVIPQILASWKGAAAVPGWVKLLQLLLVAPGVVAVVAAGVNGGWPAVKALLGRLVRWRAPGSVWAAVLLGPPLAFGLAAWVGHVVGAIETDPAKVGSILGAFLPIFVVYLVLNTEELAWRGYVLPRMQARFSPLAASLILGPVWAAFHAPYFFMKGGHPGGLTPWIFVPMVLALTVLLTGVFNASGGSVLLVHVFHQSVNAWAEALPYLPRFAGSRWPATIGTVLLVVAAGALALRPWMRRRPDASPVLDRA